MSINKFLNLTIITIILSGCVTLVQDPVQPIPQPNHPESSVLSIDVTIKAGFSSRRPEQIYFAKVDSEGGLLQQPIIRSNYMRDGRVYLLNAQPGTYVAVAETRLGNVSSRPVRFTSYFAKELVEQTKVTIGTNDFAFMGRYIVDLSMWTRWNKGDAVQTHYMKLTSPAFVRLTMGYIPYRGALLQRFNDEQSRNDAVRNAKEDLGNEWAVRIK